MNDWIEWKGGECPVPADTVVNVRFRNGRESMSDACNWCWSHGGSSEDIVAYRVVKEADAATPKTTTDVAQILTERGERYGKFTRHAEITQQLKQLIKHYLEKSGTALAYDQQESLDMICHKIARIVNGDPDYADSWVDIAGYAKLVADRLQGVER